MGVGKDSMMRLTSYMLKFISLTLKLTSEVKNMFNTRKKVNLNDFRQTHSFL